MWHKRFSADIWERCCFDPVSLTAATMATTAVAGGISAAGTLAGGSYAKQAGEMQQAEANYEADVATQNANQALASGQRQSFDTALKTKLAVSTARANAAGNGVNAGTGSAAEAQRQLAQRGSYAAAMDMFNGESAQTGLLNEATAKRYSGELGRIGGEQAQKASYFQAAATLAGTAGNMMKSYGSYAYPQSFKA